MTTRGRRWWTRLGVGALLVSLTAGCAAHLTAGPARVSQAIAEPARSAAAAGILPGDYLALGDSITYGSHPALPGERGPFLPYPDVVAARYGLRVVNAACPGETSASLIDMHAQSHGCENSPGKSTGFRQHHKLRVQYSGSQLAFAESYLRTHPDTRLVSVAIGLNDLFVCRELQHGCHGAALTELDRRLGTNLDTIVSGLRDRGGYRGPIVLLSYYATRYPSAQIEAINTAIAAAAARHHTLLADGYAAFAAAAGASGLSCAAHLLALRPDGACDLHPSAHGQAVLAAAVERAVRSRP